MNVLIVLIMVSHVNIDWKDENHTTMSLLDAALDDDHRGYICQEFIDLFKKALNHDPRERIGVDQIEDELHEYLIPLSMMSDPRKYNLTYSRFGNSMVQPNPKETISKGAQTLRQMIRRFCQMKHETIDNNTNTNTLIHLCNQNHVQLKQELVEQAINMFGKSQEQKSEMKQAVNATKACLLARLFAIRYFDHKSVICEHFSSSRLGSENVFTNFDENELNIGYHCMIEQEYCENMVNLRDEYLFHLGNDYRM